MKVTKKIMSGALEIFDKNFPDEKNTPIIKESRFETLKKKSAPYLKIYTLNKKPQLLPGFRYSNIWGVKLFLI